MSIQQFWSHNCQSFNLALGTLSRWSLWLPSARSSCDHGRAACGLAPRCKASPPVPSRTAAWPTPLACCMARFATSFRHTRPPATNIENHLPTVASFWRCTAPVPAHRLQSKHPCLSKDTSESSTVSRLSKHLKFEFRTKKSFLPVPNSADFSVHHFTVKKKFVVTNQKMQIQQLSLQFS